MSRVLNFSAGPSAIPLAVLERAQAEFTDYHGLGFSIMEVSHRGKVFEELHNNAIAKVREFYNIGDDYAVLFLQGGATLQFAQIPLNIYAGGVAEYANTGVWTQKAIKEAKIQNINYKVVASSEDVKFDHIPKVEFSDNLDGKVLIGDLAFDLMRKFANTKLSLGMDKTLAYDNREANFR